MRNDNLIAARKHSGMTRTEIAKKTGITDVGYFYYEHCNREPKVGTAIKIAAALGVRDLRELWSRQPTAENQSV